MGKARNDKTKTISYMVRMFYKALGVAHPNIKNAKHFFGSLNLVTDDKSKTRDEHIHPLVHFIPEGRKLRQHTLNGAQEHAPSTRLTGNQSWKNSCIFLLTQQTGWSGVFDTLLPAAGSSGSGTMRSFTMGTWNARLIESSNICKTNNII